MKHTTFTLRQQTHLLTCMSKIWTWMTVTQHSFTDKHKFIVAFRNWKHQFICGVWHSITTSWLHVHRKTNFRQLAGYVLQSIVIPTTIYLLQIIFDMVCFKFIFNGNLSEFCQSFCRCPLTTCRSCLHCVREYLTLIG